MSSAGLNALRGVPVDPLVQVLMIKLGFDLSNHRGRQFTPKLALAFDLILVMEERQKAACEVAIPSAKGRVCLLGHWQEMHSKEIPDPFQQGPEAIRKSYEQILCSVTDWVSRIMSS